MQNTMKTPWVLLQAISLSLLVACGSAAPAQYTKVTIGTSVDNTDSGAQSSDPVQDQNQNQNQSQDQGKRQEQDHSQSLTIPSAPQVAPSDILDQVVFEGTGGDLGERWCPCITVSGNMLLLEGFEPNQRLRLVAYDEYTFGEGEYYTDWDVATDSSGYLELSLSGNSFSDITFFAFDPSTGIKLGPANRQIYPREVTTQPPSSDPSAVYAKISSQVVEVNLRSTPGYTNKDDTYDVITKIPSGEIVEVINGPEKADGLSWWFVSWNGKTGWLADHTGSGRAILLVIP